LSLGIHCSYRNKRGATTEKKKKKKKKMAIQKNLEQHSCLFPYLRARPLPPPLSSFLFSGNRAIGNSSILRQANEDFQKQLQQQLQEKDSSILRFFDFTRRCEERKRKGERRSSCWPISQNQAPHIFFEQALSEACLLSRSFVYLLVVVAIVDRPRLDLCVLFWSV
jgi:hypothetical protein